MGINMKLPFKYWGFVSYSHADLGVAHELARRLGTRKVPPAFRDRVEGGKAAFGPFFVDEQSASAGSVLSDELRAALSSSRKLIVICSPNAVASKYVAGEIEFFQSLGRERDILCVNAYGQPNASEDDRPGVESFPEPLRYKLLPEGQKVPIPEADRPLAADLKNRTTDDWRRVLEQIETGLLDVKRVDLDRLHNRRRFKALILGGAAAAVLACAVCYYLWAMVWPHHTYSADIVRRWGVWEAVQPIKQAEARQRPASWRLERKGAFGPVERVLLVNQFGNCPKVLNDPDVPNILSITEDKIDIECSAIRACGYKLDYGSNGGIQSEMLIDQYGNRLQELTYPKDTPNEAILSEAVLGCSQIPSRIESVELERYGENEGPKAGFDRKIRFKGGENKEVQPNQSYAYGVAIDYDAAGHITERTWLDNAGKPFDAKYGYATVRTRRAEDGRIIEQAWLNADGDPATPTHGYSYAIREAGDGLSSNEVTVKVLDAKGRPTTTNAGNHAARHKRNGMGQLIEATDLDIEGKAKLNKHGYATLVLSYDPYGFVDGVAALDGEGSPVMLNSSMPNCYGGCYRMAWLNSSHGESLSSKCLGRQSEHSRSLAGWHESRTEYTPQGYAKSVSFWDAAGKPSIVVVPDGKYPSSYHRQRNEWDAKGRRTSSKHFAVDGALAIDEEGFFLLRVIFNIK